MTSEKRGIWRIAFCFWVFSTLTFMAGMSIGASIFMLTSLVLLYQDRERRLGISAFRGLAFPQATLALFVWSVITVLVAWLIPPLGIPLDNGWELTKFHYFLYPFAVALAIRGTDPGTPVAKHVFWRVLECMAIFISLVTIAQFWGRYLFPEPWLKYRFFREIAATPNFHGQGLMMFHLSFASALCFSVAYFTARLVWNAPPAGRFGRVLLWVTPILTTIATFYSFSRTVWVALAGIFVLIAFLRKPRWGVGALAAVCLSLFLLWNFDASFRQRTEDSYFSIRGRVIVWAAAWEMVKERPLTGVGHGKTGRYSEFYSKKVFGQEEWFASHAHNNFLEMASSTGVIGLLVFLAWWGVLLAYAIRSFKTAPPEEKWLSAGVLAALFAFHINGLTQVNFYDGKSQHSLMLWAGIVLAQYLNFGRKKA